MTRNVRSSDRESVVNKESMKLGLGFDLVLGRGNNVASFVKIKKKI